MSRVPEDVRRRVIEFVYRQASEAGWQVLTQVEKGQMYDRWVTESAVGGQLHGYVKPDRLRTWLKNGPMKAYADAVAGVGPYAKFSSWEGATPAKAVRAALGTGWAADLSSASVKPLRVAAHNEEGQSVKLVYGASGKFKELLWAGLNCVVDGDEDVRILVLENFGPVPSSERRRQSKLAETCGLTVTWGST